MNVAQILEGKGADVFTVNSDARISEAVDLLNANNIGALVVVDTAGRVVGILSERDIVRRLSGDRAAVLAGAISQVMTAKPFTCTRATEIDELMHIMTDKRIRHMPVVEDGELVGVVSIGDVVKRKIEEIEHEAAALREYITS
ncbi:MAG: CBS domain-containing protein [Alphaproteobacteria bacterium]|nr:CBS domain-containing protein [Alphaproteobacteria bacterium]